MLIWICMHIRFPTLMIRIICFTFHALECTAMINYISHIWIYNVHVNAKRTHHKIRKNRFFSDEMNCGVRKRVTDRKRDSGKKGKRKREIEGVKQIAQNFTAEYCKVAKDVAAIFPSDWCTFVARALSSICMHDLRTMQPTIKIMLESLWIRTSARVSVCNFRYNICYECFSFSFRFNIYSDMVCLHTHTHTHQLYLFNSNVNSGSIFHFYTATYAAPVDMRARTRWILAGTVQWG